MATITMRRGGTRFVSLRTAICALVGMTALVHLSLGVTTGVMLATQPELVASLGGATALTVMAALFCCNFAGYVGLGAALYLPALRRFQQVTRWTLIGYTAARFHTTLNVKTRVDWHTTGYCMSIRQRDTDVAVAIGSDKVLLNQTSQALASLGFS